MKSAIAFGMTLDRERERVREIRDDLFRMAALGALRLGPVMGHRA